MSKYIKKNKFLLFGIIVTLVISSIFAVMVQFLKGDVLDYALLRNDTKTLMYAILLVSFILLEIAFQFGYDYLRAHFSIRCVKELREDFFRSMIYRTYMNFTSKSNGDYIAKYTNDVDMIQTLYFGTIPLFLEILIKVILVSISLFLLDWRLAIVTLILLTTPLYIPKLIEKKLQNSQKEYSEAVEQHLSRVTDWLSGFEIIKNYSIEHKIFTAFQKSNEYTLHKALHNKQLNYVAGLISTLISYLSYFIVLSIAAVFVLIGEFTAGDFFVAIGMIDQLSYPLIALSQFIQDLISIKPICYDMAKFIEEGAAYLPENKASYQHMVTNDFNHSIYLSNITFGFQEGEELIHNFSAEFKKNQHYLIKGRSGCGKTTLINLLLKYYSLTEGTIMMDGELLTEDTNVYDFITIVRQEAFLFMDTLRNNLSMYTNCSDDDLILALKEVNLMKYASKECLDMLISEGGNNLSGGEKKRICIARALLRNTNVLIFDEPLANLDMENMLIIEDVLLKISDRTVIIVSHQFTENNYTRLDHVITMN
ncbi:ABC transporter ATP-binding protein [Anaeromicropila herbilytica]|uniref:ABC transporter ATP-binding protein n=1 Tax=Anaeromicropila herbilytica TaxID=2785025 RepID=A0A7R7EHF2_9FIRM|nr:ABC transporter ATP-binding protein [Anaeromicropila herbilytica]BCN28785.1 hypothetical protein bsdtb5_00800 [Anaeromicropila herbilytica]